MWYITLIQKPHKWAGNQALLLYSDQVRTVVVIPESWTAGDHSGNTQSLQFVPTADHQWSYSYTALNLNSVTAAIVFIVMHMHPYIYTCILVHYCQCERVLCLQVHTIPWCIINVYPHGVHGVPLLQIVRISKHDGSIHLLAHSVMEYSQGNNYSTGLPWLWYEHN